MIKQKALTALILTFLVSGCFETKEEIEARRAQFNGKTVAQVSSVIGKPIAQDKSKAIWRYENSYYKQVPYQVYQSGIWITLYRSEYVSFDCTYTATLSAGRVITSHYIGNSCRRYSPKIKKKK